jgi:hypothetical protein
VSEKRIITPYGDALKPCPCCGGEAQRGSVADPDDKDFGAQFIYCRQCDLTTALVWPLKNDVTRELMERWNKREHVSEKRDAAPTISAGGAFELKLYGTPGYVGTIAGITVHADPTIPEHTVVIRDELGRELGRIINVGS